MGYLLKEALKTLCGVNEWSYGVFWKIGCQNPKLLIWEECYYEAVSCSGFSGNGNLEMDFQDYNNSSVSDENCILRSGVSAVDQVHLLLNKMMMENHVEIVGEGLVGRAAFTGNYQWMSSENFYREAHQSKVLKEVYQQFSAGMQTVTVIPVLPHGVVQFGSYFKIAENIGFVNDVMSLIHQLGHIPGVLPPENYPLHPGYSTHEQLPLESNTINASSSSAQTSVFDNQTSFALGETIHNETASSIMDFHSSNAQAKKLEFSSQNQFINGVVSKAEVIIPSNSNIWMNRQSSLHVPRFEKDSSSSGLKNLHLSKDKKFAKTVKNVSELMPSFVEGDRNKKIEDQIHLVNNTNYDGACIQTQSGDDLFDVLGADFKKTLLSGLKNKNTYKSGKIDFPSKMIPNSSEIYSSSQVNSERDHLLDAVVSKVHLDDNISCMTTLTNTSGSFASKASVNYGHFGDFDQVKGELLGIPKFVAKVKEDSKTFSHGSSVYDSWAEKGRNMKLNNSVATGYSNKPHETSKPNRKRLKPGENPKPRPKDRQMIQDRVKELREIVPNGAKCSIDALLQRTIKHMLFLQGVTKHADKLKQSSGSKIISKDGGLVLKDNNGGGATWAYEVGSQSMVCPIIVEDLNQPHQMLVEMLCEERGLFLEIADIIRGLGLTILKGLMENRSDKIWVRFVVEANSNVTRMEVFLSLVRLLEKNSKTGIPRTNRDNDMIVQEFHQAASVSVND